jgi:DnaJ family protein C protein 22
VGWIRDLWRIPEYVRDANDDTNYLKQLKAKMKERGKPPFSVSLFLPFEKSIYLALMSYCI